MGLSFLIYETEMVDPKLMGFGGGFKSEGSSIVPAFSKCSINVHPLSLLKLMGIEGLWKEIFSFSATDFLHMTSLLNEHQE